MNNQLYVNNNGIEYYILASNADRALLFDFNANKYVIASGFDTHSPVWGNGRYFFEFHDAVLAWTLTKAESEDYLAWDLEDFGQEVFLEDYE